jgi:hypothetical protein
VNYYDVDGMLFTRIFEWGIDFANMAGIHPEDWGTRKGDFWRCFAQCLECNKAADPISAAVSFIGAGGPFPKSFMGVEKLREGNASLGSLIRHLGRKWKYVGKYVNFLKGRPYQIGKLVRKTSGALFWIEGAYALSMETKCTAQCAGYPNSY